MSLLKKLAGETAIYGLSSIVGRFLNFLLVSLHTRVFVQSEYGVVSDLYAWSGFLMVVFAYRMEAAFFRFGTPAPDRERSYTTATLSLFGTTVLLAGLLFLFAQPIATFMEYGRYPEYIRWFSLILAFDALCELPFARLRLEQRPVRFVSIRLINIGINVALNLFWLWYCPIAAREGADWVHQVWSPQVGVGYVFLANLCASAVTLLLLLPEFRRLTRSFDAALWRQMLVYAGPLVISGFAGIVNEMLDRASMKYLLSGNLPYRLEQLGIYGANYKLTMLISMFTQAYRYAAEPFFFRNAGTDNALQTQADAAKWYTITASGGMLAVLLYLDIAKHFIDARYHVGLAVVPILSVANVLLGVYYNFSVWYRLKDKTAIGAGIAITGALITVLANIVLIPRIGYMGAAWATLLCYTFMATATWYTGRRHYPVAYPLGRMFFYVALALALFGVLSGLKVLINSQILVLVAATGLFLLFIMAVWFLELRKPKSV